MTDCLFCKIIKKEIPSETIYENENVIVFLDINPVNPGHVLVVSKEHYVNILDAPEETLKGMIAVVKKIAPVILESVGMNDFCLGVNNGHDAGQVVDHIHFHIMPRCEGDGHKHWKPIPYKEGEMKELAQKIIEKI